MYILNWYLVLIVFDVSFEDFDFIFDDDRCRLVTSFRNESRIVPVCYIFICGYFLFVLLAIQKAYSCPQQPFVSLVVVLSIPQSQRYSYLWVCWTY